MIVTTVKHFIGMHQSKATSTIESRKLMHHEPYDYSTISYDVSLWLLPPCRVAYLSINKQG